MNKLDLKTPALLLDLDILKDNISLMQRYIKKREVILRPHIKCHKTPEIAKMQIDAGARGVMVAKLGEAEVMSNAGIKNIAIANQVVQEKKIEELINLNRHNEVSVAVDNPLIVDLISKIAARENVKIKVMIEVDIGMGRCGVLPGEPAQKLAEKISKSKNIIFDGLMGYEGMAAYEGSFEKRKQRCHVCYKKLIETAHLIEEKGLEVKTVSAGGTTSFSIAAEYPGITEIQAGSYVIMDLMHKIEGVPFDYALSVLTTVVSKPHPYRAIIDGGLKTFSEVGGFPKIKSMEGIELYQLDEEHGYLKIKNQNIQLEVGDTLEFIPAYSSTTVNLHDKFYVMKGDEVQHIWKIAARGRVD
jgi:D-serine deaminase-like pyridoxal phosphate-dependent protein